MHSLTNAGQQDLHVSLKRFLVFFLLFLAKPASRKDFLVHNGAAS